MLYDAPLLWEELRQVPPHSRQRTCSQAGTAAAAAAAAADLMVDASNIRVKMKQYPHQSTGAGRQQA
jgi:hypothetical protein